MLTVCYVCSPQVFCFIEWSLLLPLSKTSPGLVTLDEATHIQMLAAIAISLKGVVQSFAKNSVGLILIGIMERRWFTICTWVVIALSWTSGFSNLVFYLNQCTPTSAIWDASLTGAQCLSKITVNKVTNSFTYIDISTDFLLAMAPAVFLWGLAQPLAHRLIVFAFMSLGLLVCAAAVVRVVYQNSNTNPNLDLWGLAVTLSNWTMVELILSVIAGCLPFLKTPCIECLGSVGIKLQGGSTPHRSSFHGATVGSIRIRNHGEGPVLSEFDASSNVMQQDYESSKNILVEMDVRDRSQGTSRDGSVQTSNHLH